MIKLRFNWKVLTIAFFTLLSSCEKDPELSNEALITNFSFGGVTATISGNTITASVPYGTDITNVAPQIAVSAGATITPASGLARDFSSPLTYTVTAEDGQTTTTFTVTITVLDPDTVVISGFAVADAESVDIDQAAKTITINILEGKDITALSPVITTIPADATVNPASGAAQDFTESVSYTVSAGSVTSTYTASVNVIATGFDVDNVVTYFDASVGGSSLKPEQGTSGDNERGYSMNSTHVYMADKGDNKIYFWDVNDPNSSAEALPDTNGVVTGGVWRLADVVATENGILGSNMNWAGGAFKVYRWNNNTSEPEVILEYATLDNGANIRLGDHFTFAGDPQGNGKLYAMPFPGFNSVANNTFVLVWTMENGVITDQANPEKIEFAEIGKAGNYGHVVPISSGGTDYLLVNGANITPTLYSSDGSTKLTTIGSDAIGVRTMGGEIFEFNNARYLAVTLTGSEGADIRDAGIRVYNISGDDIVEAMNAITLDTVEEKLVLSDSYGQNINGNVAGDVKVVVGTDQVLMMSGAANNGFRVLKVVKSE
jgi:hypothetical protein